MVDGEQARRPNLFISYARGDDEPFVDRLHRDLKNAGFPVWWDRAAMESRGRTFLQEIRDAIEGVDRVIAVIGPKAVMSEVVRYEWEHASLFAKAVVPILRLGSYDLIPDEILPKAGYGLAEDALNRRHGEDFRDDRRYDQALKRLIDILGQPVPNLGSLDGTPALPPHFLSRRDDIKRLRETVLADVQRPTVITSAKQTVALQGMGGVGKSVLAAAFARTISTRRAFNDGVVWLVAGQEASRVTLFNNMKALGIALEDKAEHYVNEQAATTRLSELLAEKVCLIVLDDVWSVDQVRPFRTVLGPRCRLLVTTRDGGLVTSLGAQEHSVDVLGDEQAFSLLAEWSGQPKESLPPDAAEIVRECGNLPLALAMVGAVVRDNPNRWTNALHRLRHADLEKIKWQFPDYPYLDLLRAIQVSVDTLEVKERERYFDLAIFPEHTSIPEATLQTFWDLEGLDEFDSQDMLDLFVRRSLALRDDEGRIILHDLQSDYIRKQIDDLPALHQRLVEAYRLKCSDGWASGRDDGYFFRYLPLHLAKAGRGDELRALLLDYDWLLAKLRATDAQALISDCDLLAEDSEIRVLQATSLTVS